MDCGIIVPKGNFEAVRPDTVELAKTFANEAVECRVRAFLGTTFNDHVHHFDL